MPAGFVNGLASNFDPGDEAAAIVTKRFVVVAWHVDDAHTAIHFPKDFMKHGGMRWRPIPAMPQAPAVDNVTDKIERVAGAVRQEIRKRFGLAPARAKMHIRDEDGPVPVCSPGAVAAISGPQPIYRQPLKKTLRERHILLYA